jgi:hypothetical protein
MSYPAQPPQQPGGNPYGQGPGQPAPYGQAPNPYGQQQPPNQFPQGQFPGQQSGGQFGGGFPQPQPRRGNVGLGIVVGLVVALVGAGVYGAILGSVDIQIGYLAVAIGFVSGLLAGKVGGPHPAIPVVTAVFALLAVYLGQILGISILASKLSGGASFVNVLLNDFQLVQNVWKESLEPLTFLFFALGAVGAVSGAKKAS